MQSIVDKVNTAAQNTGKFGRIEGQLIESAKDGDYPFHFAWERSAEFDSAFRGGGKDEEGSAQFGIVAKADNYTFGQLESLWESVVTNALKNQDLEIEDFDSFDAHFGGTRVRIALYEISQSTTRCF